MNQKSTGPNKFKRLKLILEILHRYGPSTRSEISAKVTVVFGTNPKSTAQAVYRDLTELEIDGEITKIYTDYDGYEVQQENEEVKGIKCLYSLTAAKKDLATEAIFKNDYDLLLPAFLKNQVKFTTDLSRNLNMLNIAWQMHPGAVAIHVEKSFAPFDIVFFRSGASTNNTDHLKIFKASRKRSIFIGIPDAGVSSCKSVEQPGHFSVGVDSDLRFVARDFASRNGTSIFELNNNQLESRLTKLQSSDLKTSDLGTIRKTGKRHIRLGNVITLVPEIFEVHVGDRHTFLVY